MGTLVFNESSAAMVMAAAVDASTLLAVEHGCGWFDGGCLTLAAAIKVMYPCSTEIYHVSRTHSVIDHAVIFVRSLGLFFDADGMQTKAELMHKMKTVELCDVTLCAPIVNVEDTDIVIFDDVVEALIAGTGI